MGIIQKKLSGLLTFCSLLFVSWTVAGCGATRFASPETRAGATPFVPPTLAALISTAPGFSIESEESQHPALIPTCTPDLTFMDDLSIPDGTAAASGEKLDKRWQVENSGSCNWDEQFRIRLVAGSSLGADTEQALYPARSGTQAMIRIQFTAPQDPGTYRSAWQAHTASGEPFGDLFFIEFVVQDE